ncbi:hypothetical protein Q1695_015503 [Nippostrongylus brasiliensis]|nr:hypothetical protein Q1695_015503 [Nippostrongylus brasiliensis]
MVKLTVRPVLVMSSTPLSGEDVPVEGNNATHEATQSVAVATEPQEPLQPTPPVPQDFQESLQRIKSKVETINDKLTRIEGCERYMIAQIQ